ncbi:MAG TPA: alpha/beta fold hydrolase, partial [Gemmatimonadaceae bacterium]|nr:alpha/beta fold hydrolase [Gemmatimonadaceae bacterium]
DLHPVGGGVQRFLEDPLPPARARECLTRLRGRADPAQYTTLNAVEDLREALDALGYARVNLYGGAYGSRVALAFLRRYPQRVRSVVLRSAVPPQYVLPLPYAQGAQRALDRLLADCAADDACRATYPHLGLDLEAVLSRLRSAAVVVDVLDPESGRTERARLTRDVFAERLRQMLVVPELAARVPLLLHRASQNDYVPFANAAAALGAALESGFRAGLYLAVTCNEDIPRISPTAPDSAAGESFLGAARARQHVAACEGWPRSAPAWQELEPVQSTVPTLVVSGGNDPVTPPQWGGLAARALSQGLHLIVPGAAHSDTGPCAQGVVAAFIDRASVQGLDVSCVEKVRRPPFAMPDDSQRR